MNSDYSCVQSLSRVLRNKNISINFDGKISKLLHPLEYRRRISQLITLIVIGFLAHLIKKIPYHPITIIGNTVYSRVAASCLKRYNIPYVLCKSNNRTSYYEISSSKDIIEIPFEGPSPQFFSNCEDKVFPLIPLSTKELQHLTNHTKFRGLEYIQAKILESFPRKDNVHLTYIKDLVHDGSEAKNPVIEIRKFCGNLYYIITTNEVWLTRLLITDNVLPLQPGDIIYSVCSTSKQETHDVYSIDHMNNSCIICSPVLKTSLYYRQLYHVASDLSIHKMGINASSNNHIMDITNENQIATTTHTTNHQELQEESILYGLKNTRPFHPIRYGFTYKGIGQNIFILHPFHFPKTWDPFLTIMILTLALLNCHV